MYIYISGNTRLQSWCEKDCAFCSVRRVLEHHRQEKDEHVSLDSIFSLQLLHQSNIRSHCFIFGQTYCETKWKKTVTKPLTLCIFGFTVSYLCLYIFKRLHKSDISVHSMHPTLLFLRSPRTRDVLWI